MAIAGWVSADWPSDNRIERWAAQLGSDEGWQALVERFGGDEFVLVRDSQGTLDQDELRETFRSLAAVERCVDAASLPGGVDGELARALDLTDVASGRYDYLLVVRPDSTTAERAEMVAVLDRLREEVRGEAELRFAGHPLVAAALDAESRDVERRFAPALVVIASLVTAAFLRSIWLAAATLLPALLAATAPRAALEMAGVDSDLLLVALGPLAFVLLLASTLHLSAAYARLRRSHDVQQARRLAVREKLPAGMLAAATTAAGFGVFVASDLNSVKLLGATVAATMLVGVPLAYLAATPLFGAIGERRYPTRLSARSTGRGPWRTIALAATRRRYLIAPLALLGLVLGVVSGLTLPSETNALHYFPDGHVARDDFLAIEASGTHLSSVDVLVERLGAEPWNAEELVDAGLSETLAEVAGVSGVFGPETLRDLPGVARAVALGVAGRVDEERRFARWTARFETAEAGPTRELVGRVRSAADSWSNDRGARAWVTGSVPALLAMQEVLVETLIQSLALTALVTTLCFLSVTRRLRTLLIALLVNLLPVALTLVAARALSIPLDGATVMVAAVVLGLAVDNTLHLVHAAHAGNARARLRAFDLVGRAAFVSSLALALGFGALALTGFAPTSRFGLLCAVGSLSALLADLVVLPALWVAPRGGKAVAAR